MKKPMPQLKLNRETVVALNLSETKQAVGGHLVSAPFVCGDPQ